MASGMEEENAQDQGETEAPDPQALRYISTPETKSGLAGQRTSGCRAPWAVAMRMSRDHGPRLGGRIFEPRWRHSQPHTQQAEWPDTRRRLRDPARRRRSEGGAVGRTPRPGPASFVPPRAPIGCSPETADLGRGPIGRARCRSAVGSLAIGGAAAGGLNRSPAGAGFARVPRWVGPRLCGAARLGGGPGRAGRSDGRSSGTAAAVGARGEAGGAWAVARAALAEGGAARAGPGAAAAAAAAAGARRRGPLPLEAPREMLSGSLPEDSEAKEGERWYDPQDLQRDLQLAAELGKTLLDRNTELEESLQQMYTTNQEQLQEIEYLTKQVELLRQMNEQHAKVYEQLDITARELEDTNHKLVAESKASQQKIVSLTETIECLQTNIDHLQSQVEELKAAEQRSRSQGKCEQKWASSLSSLKELYDLRQHFVYDHVFAERIASLQSEPSPEQEEHERLRRAVAALQAQLGGERRRRQALEEELGLAARENGDLERQLGAARDTRARALQLEAEVAELRRRLRAEAPPEEEAAPGALFLPFPSREPGPSLLEELCLAAAPDAPAPPRPLRRSRSDAELGGPAAPAHEDACARRAGPVARRGVALLHEVDLRYSALQAKYDELLRSCRQDPDSLAHKAVQTARPPPGAPAAGARSPQRPGSPGPAPPPEYKALFQEIFSCIRKTKQEIHEHRTKFPALAPQP